jgi:hypothetical protein
MAAFDISKDIGIINEYDFKELEEEAEVLVKKISSLRKRLKSTPRRSK